MRIDNTCNAQSDAAMAIRQLNGYAKENNWRKAEGVCEFLCDLVAESGIVLRWGKHDAAFDWYCIWQDEYNREHTIQTLYPPW